jgi:ribosome-binding protein aMBF1 (putative translation factor)
MPEPRRASWQALRDRRMAEPDAAEEYEAARIAFELGREVKTFREQKAWSQSDLAEAAGMTQSAVARFEAGGTVPTIRVLERIAAALDMELRVELRPRSTRPAKRSAA